MAYSELIKSFERIRDYLREFYVYGFRTRGQYDKKSLRSYDNERRRLESYLGDYIGSHRSAAGKNVFLSINSRTAGGSPLARVFKAKSFTDGDITLHFILFDMLRENALPLSEITKKLDEYLDGFESPMSFEESTIRKKLGEYIKLGLVKSEKRGKQTIYSLSPATDMSQWRDALEFFSETTLCGVLGSFLLDKLGGGSEVFTFKHRYDTRVLESEVACTLLEAISQKKRVEYSYKHRSQEWSQNGGVPLKIIVSVQTGRRWAIISTDNGKLINQRLDNLRDVKICSECPQFDALRERFSRMEKNIWGTTFDTEKAPERVSFTVHIGDGEEYIYKKLLREKRCGRVERLDEHTARFSAEIYNSGEIVPWVRNFIGNIIDIDFSDKQTEQRIKQDMDAMYLIYEEDEG